MNQSCHGATPSPVTGALIVNEWLASTHNTNNGAGCADCHEPDAGHPNLCNKCHGGGGFGVTVNPDQAGKCGKCHGLNHPQDVMVRLSPAHFGNQTTSYLSNNYRASYVSSNYAGNCRKCHNPHDTSTASQVAHDWAGSGHGNVTKARTNADFKTRGTYQPVSTTFQYFCVRCHTTTGFVNFAKSGFQVQAPFAGPGYPVVQNAPVTVAPGASQPADTPSLDKTKEVTGCDACHDDGKGNAYGYQVRKVGAAVIYYNFSSSNSSPTVKLNNKPVSYPDVGDSNVCVPCHTGRGIGSMIYDAQNAGMDFKNTNSPGAHDRATGLTLFQKGGYEFAGLNYSNPIFQHSKVGLANFNGTGNHGPCVACHMTGTNTHTFSPVSFDSTGAVNAIISTACNWCHNGVTSPTISIATYNAKKTGYQSALAILNALRTGKTATLANRNTNYEALYAGGGANTMGAAFNYSMLNNETGAFAHNPLYAKRLIWDSIDWLYNGAIDNDVVAAINSVPLSTKITAATKTSAINWLTTAEDGTPITGRP
ncbi:MAG TPA: cytochrome C [Geomonas sp.]|nr:cytochrome C [Geomonas sp.]